MDYIAPISEVRGCLPLYIKKMNKSSKHLIITKNGKAEAVVLTPQELETLEVKADRALMMSLLRAVEDLKSGKIFSHDEVFKHV